MDYLRFEIPVVRDPRRSRSWKRSLPQAFFIVIVEKCGLCWYPFLTPMVL